MDDWVSVLALVVAGAALAIAWWQLVLQRDAAGGRGIIFDIRAPMRKIHERSDGTRHITNGYRVYVRTVGNDRYEVSVHLERDGRRLDSDELESLGIDKPPPVLNRWTCDDEPIRWNFDLEPDVAEGLWCVLLWVSPYGEAIRTDGFRRRLGHEPQFEEWHWSRFYRSRRRFESWGARRRWAWTRRLLGRPQHLGAWRPYLIRELQAGQSPSHSAVDE